MNLVRKDLGSSNMHFMDFGENIKLKLSSFFPFNFLGYRNQKEKQKCRMKDQKF